jgi:hypothetical protein
MLICFISLLRFLVFKLNIIVLIVVIRTINFKFKGTKKTAVSGLTFLEKK